MKSFALFVLSVAIFSGAFAGVETVEIGKIQIAKTLSGTVVDPADSAMPGVQVLEVSSDWKTVLRTTTTDNDGKWFLAPVPWATGLLPSLHHLWLQSIAGPDQVEPQERKGSQI